MSKIKVDEIESSSSNVKLSPKGTGLVKVKAAGGVDGTLQLTAAGGSNAVKIKSPAQSTGQAHTIILPDNNAVADGHLHVKSVTGSGATAVGQLEFKSFPVIDTSNMSTSSFTTGQLPGSALPAQTASQGAALKLISNSVVTGAAVNYIEFIDLPENNNYFIVGKKLIPSASNNPYIDFRDQYGNVLNTNYRKDFGFNAYNGYNYYYQSANKVWLEYNDKSAQWTNQKGVFTMDLSIHKTSGFSRCYFFINLGQPSDYNTTFYRVNGARTTNYSNAIGRVRIYAHNNTTVNWQIGTEIQLFQYLK